MLFMDQGVKIDHSPASGAEVKYEWRHTSVSPTCLPDVGSDELSGSIKCGEFLE